MITDLILKLFKKDPTVKRHLLKTVSWRIIGSIDTAILGWIVSGRLSIGAQIGSFELLTKMFLYFFHERVWHRIRFGLPTRSGRAEIVRSENAPNLFAQKAQVTRSQREELNGNRAFTIWLTGLSASGKSTIAAGLDSRLFKMGLRCYVIDGDNTRLGINSDLSFSKEDRSENIRRVAEICRLFNDAGIIAIASFISPFAEDRAMAKKIIGENSFVETFVDASIDTCKQRDVKGLYKLAEAGKIKDFTGVDSPYERPVNAHIHLHTDTASINSCINKVLAHLQANELIEAQVAGEVV